MKRNSLRCIIAAFRQAIQDAHGIAAIPPSKRLYQFKITLLNVDPVIWRRIQIKDCSVDKLHACIQTAMGWTNSHLHQFELQGIVCGDPELLCEDGDCFVGTNSLKTMVSDIVPQSGARFRFSYEYDFGDRWEHEVNFNKNQWLTHDRLRTTKRTVSIVCGLPTIGIEPVTVRSPLGQHNSQWNRANRIGPVPRVAHWKLPYRRIQVE